MMPFGGAADLESVEYAMESAANGVMTHGTVPTEEFEDLLKRIARAGELTPELRAEGLRMRQEAEDELTFGAEPAADSEES